MVHDSNFISIDKGDSKRHDQYLPLRMESTKPMVDEEKSFHVTEEASNHSSLTHISEEQRYSTLPRSPSPAAVSRTDSALHSVRSSNDQGDEQFRFDHGGEDDESRAGVAMRPDHDPYEVSFDGDQDPMCPLSMPLVQKWVIVVVVCTGTLCVTCASSIYTATFTQMNAEFGTTSLISTLGLSSFVLGIALGPLLTSPLSEYYGRRPIYLASWSMFTVFTIPSAVGKNIQTLVIARFLSGFVGGTFLSVAGGTVGDVFSRKEIQTPMVLVSSAPFVGPSLGPVIGGFINYYTQWRWTYYFVIIWSAILWLSIVFFAPETYHPIRLRAKAEQLRRQTGNNRYEAPMEKIVRSRRKAIAHSLLRPFQLLLLEPMCLCLDLYSAILLGILYLFFGAFPLVFRTNHGMNLWQVGLTFLGIITGILVAAASNPIWSKVSGSLLEKQGTGPAGGEPEYRLPPAILGGVLIPTGLFWFGWTTYSSIHWIIPIMGSAVFGCGTLLVFTGVFTYLVDAYPQYAASALASNGFTRCSFAAAFPLFGIQMYENLGYQWATSVLAFLTVIMMPFPLMFFKYGKVLREKSRFAVST